MDLLTHAALSAAGAAALARPAQVRIAALTGAVAGVLPDTDTLIASSSDPLLNLEFHRHFSHSLLMVPIGALLVAGLAWIVLRDRMGFRQLYLFAFAGYLLSPLLDACTSYGTHLLWPFSDRPIAWSIIAIVDPLFTLNVVVLLALCLWRSRSAYTRVALALAAGYLAIGLVQHERAAAAARELASSRAHGAERLLIKPTLGNLLLWRSVYVHDGRIHVDAVRAGVFDSIRIYPGESAPIFDPERDLALPRDALQRRDVERFIAFTGGYPVRHPVRAAMIGDARYAMLPTSIEPLWGIVLDAESPDRHARFETDRKLTRELRARFIDMLLGRAVPER